MEKNKNNSEEITFAIAKKEPILGKRIFLCNQIILNEDKLPIIAGCLTSVITESIRETENIFKIDTNNGKKFLVYVPNSFLKK